MSWTQGRVARVLLLPSYPLPCRWGSFFCLAHPASKQLRVSLFGERIGRSQDHSGIWQHWDQALREEVWTGLVYGDKGWGPDFEPFSSTARHRQVCSPLITTTTRLFTAHPSHHPGKAAVGNKANQVPRPLLEIKKYIYYSEITFFILFSVWYESYVNTTSLLIILSFQYRKIDNL